MKIYRAPASESRLFYVKTSQRNSARVVPQVGGVPPKCNIYILLCDETQVDLHQNHDQGEVYNVLYFGCSCSHSSESTPRIGMYHTNSKGTPLTRSQTSLTRKPSISFDGTPFLSRTFSAVSVPPTGTRYSTALPGAAVPAPPGSAYGKGR